MVRWNQHAVFIPLSEIVTCWFHVELFWLKNHPDHCQNAVKTGEVGYYCAPANNF